MYTHSAGRVKIQMVDLPALTREMVCDRGHLCQHRTAAHRRGLHEVTNSLRAPLGSSVIREPLVPETQTSLWASCGALHFPLGRRDHDRGPVGTWAKEPLLECEQLRVDGDPVGGVLRIPARGVLISSRRSRASTSMS